MTKVHFPRNLRSYTKAQATSNLMVLLAQPTMCGQRPDRRPNVEISTNPGETTCAKCSAAMPEISIEEQMQAAHAVGDLDEVIRLAKTI